MDPSARTFDFDESLSAAQEHSRTCHANSVEAQKRHLLASIKVARNPWLAREIALVPLSQEVEEQRAAVSELHEAKKALGEALKLYATAKTELAGHDAAFRARSRNAPPAPESAAAQQAAALQELQQHLHEPPIDIRSLKVAIRKARLANVPDEDIFPFEFQVEAMEEEPFNVEVNSVGGQTASIQVCMRLEAWVLRLQIAEQLGWEDHLTKLTFGEAPITDYSQTLGDAGVTPDCPCVIATQIGGNEMETEARAAANEATAKELDAHVEQLLPEWWKDRNTDFIDSLLNRHVTSSYEFKAFQQDLDRMQEQLRKWTLHLMQEAVARRFLEADNAATILQQIADNEISEEWARNEIRNTAAETSGEVDCLKDVDEKFNRLNQDLAAALERRQEATIIAVEAEHNSRRYKKRLFEEAFRYSAQIARDGRSWEPVTNRNSGHAIATQKRSCNGYNEMASNELIQDQMLHKIPFDEDWFYVIENIIKNSSSSRLSVRSVNGFDFRVLRNDHGGFELFPVPEETHFPLAVVCGVY